jgi:outer membrane immunogenic protein
MNLQHILPSLGATVLLAFAATAHAEGPADGDFGGFYAGVDVGADFGTAKYALPGDTGDRLINPKGNATTASGGALIGYNHQAGDWVVGVEADVTAAKDVLKATACTVPDGCFVTTHDSFTTFNRLNQGMSARARLRVGKVVEGTLFYVAGGYSAEHTRMDLVGDCFNAGNPTVPLVFKFSRAKELSGFNLGAGAERALGRHLSLRAEVILDDYGSQTYRGAAPEWNDRRIDVRDTTLRAAISYRF